MEVNEVEDLELRMKEGWRERTEKRDRDEEAGRQT